MAKKRIIITAALTGAVTPKSLNPNMPITPQEIADDAYRCWQAGASIVHLHMRTDDGVGCMDRDRFAETIRLIREHQDCDVIINCTSSGSQAPVTYEQRMEHFETIPEIEMGSFDGNSFNWGDTGIFPNPPDFLVELAKCYQRNQIVPELEIFDMGFLGNSIRYWKQGLLPKTMYMQCVLGAQGAMDATPENLQYLVNHFPEGTKWSAFGIGKGAMPIMYAALAMGADGIRVGLEDNVIMGKDDNGNKIMASNVLQVERAVRVIEEFGCKVAKPSEAREILGIEQLKR